MAANDFVGVVNAMKLKTTDALGNEYETQINNTKLFVNPNTTYAKVDTFARALVGLSSNSYQDTNLITVVSVTEEVVE